jgi:CBS domain-containing protein
MNMQVSEIMTQLVHTIRADASLEQASCLLRDQNIGCAPVVEEALVEKTNLKQDVLDKIGFTPVVEEDVVVGVLTDRDIVVGGIASGKDPKTTPVSDVMNHDFTCCHEDDDISQAAAAMEEKKVRRLFVLDRDEHVMGVLSLHDISAVDPLVTGEVLHAMGKGAKAESGKSQRSELGQ